MFIHFVYVHNLKQATFSLNESVSGFFFFNLNKIPSPGGKLITNLWSGGKFYSCFKPMKVGLILEVLTQPYPQCIDMDYTAVISSYYVCVKIMRGRV